MDLNQVLKSRFGHETFQGPQKAVIESILEGKDTLLIAPTGGGKSLTYQLPSLIRDELIIVVSPLIALMQDQVAAARKMGLDAWAIHSGLKKEHREKGYRILSEGKGRLIYVTPERFRKPEIWEALKNRKVWLMAVDEAHCISQWGHDFRPDYSRLGEIREKLGNPTVLALTATATKDVREDIKKQLRFSADSNTYLEDIDRPNLTLDVEELVGIENKVKAIVEFRKQNPGPTIVYSALIQTLQKISQDLAKQKLEHLIYHGQLPAHQRQRAQTEFLNSESALLLATPAFGLGVNKPNIRGIVHAEIPGSVEAYYQEVGRSGRDGKPARALLLYDEDDLTIQMDFIKWANPEPEFIFSVYRIVKDMNDRVKAGGLDFMRDQLHFYHSRDFRLETALNVLERAGCVSWTEGQANTLQALEEPTTEMFDLETTRRRIKNQHQGLLTLVNYVKKDVDNSSDRKKFLVEYFGA